MQSLDWQLLRTKADETADDPDWVATNDPEAGTIDFDDIDEYMVPGASVTGRAYTGLEVCVVGVDSNRAVQDRGAMTVDLQLVERFPRGGALEDVLCDSAVLDDVLLQRVAYFPFNGGRFTIRVLADAGDVVDNLEVWWRPVSR